MRDSRSFFAVATVLVLRVVIFLIPLNRKIAQLRGAVAFAQDINGYSDCFHPFWMRK
ncbi:hypothetical protein SDC9_187218 [bioreactor metagenome]|uniref:Uncharacterized protein n=1 Tax=bioreactor metagenome TaxID=1076179 RepID=A0A645HN75_9ZZZZ